MFLKKSFYERCYSRNSNRFKFTRLLTSNKTSRGFEGRRHSLDMWCDSTLSRYHSFAI